MLSDVGTWAWAERSGGRLSRADRAELVRQGVLARLGRLTARWERPLPAELPQQPDSALARDADECVRELSSPALYGHCLRTWAFVALFAQRDRVAHDAAAQYGASGGFELIVLQHTDSVETGRVTSPVIEGPA